MTAPCWPAATRRPLTANSRAMITIATQPSTGWSDTSEISAAAISSLSAIGSITLPKVVTLRRRRAIQPSTPSVTAASANTIAATVDPCGVACSSATTSTGTSRIRTSVRTLGRFSGNIGPSSYPAAPAIELDADRRADRPERGDGRGQHRPAEDAPPAPLEHEGAEDDPAEAVNPAQHCLGLVVQPADPDHQQRREDRRLDGRVDAHRI